MAWLEKKHLSLYPDVANVISHFLEVGHNISMWLCGYVCWLTTKIAFRIYKNYLPTILTKSYQPSCANELQMSWQHAFNHLHRPLLQCLAASVQVDNPTIHRDGFFYTWLYWSQRGFVLFWRSFGSLRKVQVENLVHYWLTHSDPWPRW